MRKEYLIMLGLIVLWSSLGAIMIKYDYKTWPDKPGINCIDLDNPSIWPVHTNSTSR
jgi:hypothetical protein